MKERDYVLSSGVVMKFGGSSLASPSAIRRVLQIVQREQRRRILVVSAHGDTTDRLVQILKHAARAETYLCWKAIKELREYHFSLAEAILDQRATDEIDPFLRDTFRDLHVKMLEICDGERELTAADRSSVLSLGEQISSRLMAAALAAAGCSVRHLDARRLVLTNEVFCDATTRYWETYARLRWALASQPLAEISVLGGFMGAAEDGRTTVLGRGGSDLTATIAGAAMNVEEIQIWKDVDGMLTCDPKWKLDGLVVKSLSYREAATLAQAGARILHPDTIAPAERLRIPVFLRNTFQPQSEGTRIGLSIQSVSSGVKSITCRTGLMLLDITARPDSNLNGSDLMALAEEIKGQNAGVHILSCSPTRLLLMADSRTDFSAWRAMQPGCLQVRMKSDQMLMTLVGAEAENSASLIQRTLGEGASVVAGDGFVYVSVDERDVSRTLELLHAALFQSADPRVFSPRVPVAPPAAAARKAPKHSQHPVLFHERQQALG